MVTRPLSLRHDDPAAGGVLRPPATWTPAAAGITLIELLVTLAIVAVAISVVGPSVGSAVDRVRLRSLANEIIAEARHGRTTAETSGRTVWMTFADDAIHISASGGGERIVHVGSGVNVRATPPVLMFLSSGQVIGAGDIELRNAAGHVESLGLDATSGRLFRNDDPREGDLR
jgi:prepilin-type N-terminal cleavage/methylation domain-containing protein